MIIGVDLADGIQPDRCFLTTFGPGGKIIDTVEIRNVAPPAPGDVEIFDSPPKAAQEAWRTATFQWPLTQP